MNVSKNLREYIEETIHRKMEEYQTEKNRIKREKYDALLPELTRIECECLDKCRKVFTDAGLDPDEYGYGETATLFLHPQQLYFNGVRYSKVAEIVRDITLKIELDEIPKNEVRNYINNYEIKD